MAASGMAYIVKKASGRAGWACEPCMFDRDQKEKRKRQYQSENKQKQGGEKNNLLIEIGRREEEQRKGRNGR